MTIHIDTTVQGEVLVAVLKDDQELTRFQGNPGKGQAQMVLPAIESLLKEQGLRLSDVTSITVVPGPGSFTGTRVGVAVANALAMALELPINELPAGGFVVPNYAAPPTITTSTRP